MIPREPKNATFWAEWCTDRILNGNGSDMYHTAPGPREARSACPTGLAIEMGNYGLRTVLCAGNGISLEPRILVATGSTSQPLTSRRDEVRGIV